MLGRMVFLDMVVPPFHNSTKQENFASIERYDKSPSIHLSRQNQRPRPFAAYRREETGVLYLSKIRAPPG